MSYPRVNVPGVPPGHMVQEGLVEEPLPVKTVTSCPKHEEHQGRCPTK